MKNQKIRPYEEVEKAKRDTKASMISRTNASSWFELSDDTEGGEVKILSNQELIELSKVDIDIYEKLADQVRQCHNRCKVDKKDSGEKADQAGKGREQGQEGAFLPLHLQQWLAMVRSGEIIKPKRPPGRPADDNKVEHTLIRMAVADLVKQGFNKSRNDALTKHSNPPSACDVVAKVNADLGKTPSSFKRIKAISAHRKT
jgi:hypothetical protein